MPRVAGRDARRRIGVGKLGGHAAFAAEDLAGYLAA